MFCPKCGNQLDNNVKFCGRCGTKIIDSNELQENYIMNNLSNNNQRISNNDNNYQMPVTPIKKSSKGIVLTGIGILVLVILIICIIILKNNNNRFYFDEKEDNIIDTDSVDNNPKKGKYSTAIVADRVYEGVTINNKSDAYELIAKDSIDQKDKCPSSIRKVEEEIINNYGITAVNLCEMDVDFSYEVANVFKKIYSEYPSVRGYLTNLTLVNASIKDNYIAVFQPLFNFAYTKDYSTTVMKTLIELNASYFLNIERLEAGILSSSQSGHFPKNATRYSAVAHELGHYLSFLSLIKSYSIESVLLSSDFSDKYDDAINDWNTGRHSLKMIQEAYDNYKKDKGTKLSIDEWRATISKYAVTKDNSGNYIYDETIAESFHDVYLNGDNAQDASKYIIAVLKIKLQGGEA